MTKTGEPCPAALLSQVVALLQQGDAAAGARLDMLLAEYPMDPQLHFLRGSILAGEARFEEAHAEMAEAIRIAPGYALARFQLGLLQLSSGQPAAAEATWLPLETLPSQAPLRLFANGLTHLIRDEFAAAVDLLERGIALNTANPPMNADMRLVIDRINSRDGGADGEPTSATHLLLQQYSRKNPAH